MKTMAATNDNAAPVRSSKRAPITVWEIRAKNWTRFGQLHLGEVRAGHHAEIVVGESICLFGLVPAGSRYVRDEQTGRQVSCRDHVYKKTFRIGDVAECNSYNLVYVGVVRGITEKTVTIVQYEGTSGEKTYRLDLHTFDQRNWDFDAAAAAKRNADWND